MVGMIVYAAVVCILMVGCMKKPGFGLSAFLCMFGLEQWGMAKIGFVASHGSFSNYVSLATVAVAVGALLLRSRRLRVGNGLIQVLVLLLFAYSATSVLWTPAGATAVEEWRAQLPYLLVSVIVLPLLIQNLQDAKDGIYGTLLAGGILATCLAFLVEWGYRRIVSDVPSGEEIQLPLALAQLGAYVFVLSIIYMRWRGWSAVIALSLVLISAILVFKTGSRGQLIAMFLSALLFAPMARGRLLSRGYVSALILAGLAVTAIWLLVPNAADLFSAQDESRYGAERAVDDYEGRVAIATALFNAYASSGVLGMLFGLGSSAAFAPSVVGFLSAHCADRSALRAWIGGRGPVPCHHRLDHTHGLSGHIPDDLAAEGP